MIRIFRFGFILLVLLSLSGLAQPAEKVEVFAVDGELLKQGQRVNLNSQWAFLFGEHLPVNEISLAFSEGKFNTITVPSSWNDEVAKLTEQRYQHGRATYAIPLSFTENIEDPISLYASFIAGAYKIFWLPNAANKPQIIGQAGDLSNGQHAGLKGQIHHFPASSNGLLVIYVTKANMHAGGIRQPIAIQRSDILQREVHQNMIIRSLLSGGLLIMIFHYLVQFFYSRENVTALLLAFVCFSALLRGVSTAGLLEIFIQPISMRHYEISIKAEYLSVLYMSVSYFGFLCYLMPKLVPKRFVWGAFSSAAIGTFATIIMPAPLVSSLLNYYLAYLGFWCGAILLVIIIGIRQKRRFAWLILSSALILGVGAVNDVIASKNALHNVYVVEYVFYVFLFFQAQLVGLQLKESREASIVLKQEKLTLQRAHSKALMESHLDFLTGLANRLALTEWIEAFEHEGSTPPKVTSVIMFDIDHFKSVNDTYGHDVGDEVLVFVASLIHGYSLRASDFKCRFGGEEFLIILPGAMVDKAKEIAESLRITLEESIAFRKGDTEIKITASFGVAEHNLASSEPLNTVILKADEALYRSKNSGRNKVTE